MTAQAPRPDSQKPPRKRRWLWPAVAAAFLCAAAAVLFHVFARGSALDRLKQRVRGEVPFGSTRAQVEGWAHERLDGRIPSVTQFPLPDGFTRPGASELVDAATGEPAAALEVTIPCGLYTVVNGQTARNDVWVYFLLDGDGRVADYHFITLEQMAQIERMRRGP